MGGVHPGFKVLVWCIRQHLAAGRHHNSQAVVDFCQGMFNDGLYTMNRALRNFMAIAADTGWDVKFIDHINLLSNRYATKL